MRRLFALSSTLVLALGCGKDEQLEDKAECQLEAIDLSACQRSSLAMLQPEGVWNVNVLLEDGSGAAGALRLTSPSGVALALGVNADKLQVSSDTFYLSSETTTASGQKVRYAFAGCQALSASRMAGIFRRCVNGAKDLQGTFEAARVQRRVNEAEASGLELVSEAALPNKGIPSEVTVAGNKAYVSGGPAGVFPYDITNPAAPDDKEFFVREEDESYNDVLVNGDTLYVATRGNGILVFDATKAQLTGALIRRVPDTKPVEVTALAMDGNLLFAASPTPNAEVLIYDVAEPRNPKLVHRYLVEGAAPAAGEVPMDVVAANGKLYVSHWSYGLVVSDITTPTKPKLLGRFATATSRTTAVGVYGSRTIAFDSGQDWGAHLRVLDVTAPESVSLVGSFRMRDEVSIRSLKLVGTRLYVAYYQDGLRVLDVSVPGEPVQVAYYNTWRESDAGRGLTFYDGLNSVAVPGDGYIYATDTSRGLLVFRETPAP